MYLFKAISIEIQLAQKTFTTKHTKTKKLILGSIFACFAAIFQSAGGFFPGIGYLLSPLATAPILLYVMLSVPFGAMVFFQAIILLFVLQPTELIVFPFTTGLLGLGIGLSFYLFKSRLSIIAAGAFSLTLGISILLYILRFPILGPAFSNSFSLLTIGIIFIFSFLYSWLWVEIALLIFKRLRGIY
ncbi:hypothetical protein [Niallia taxi]|uniref:Uncharacterized protein n=1 Tax=Niallia taxi TaxID=2499688 RepID=A0A437K9H8_9BACI|nr:hypothetical protein [Niallia taxi]MCM3217299.1 hypothetical protein [Niallia taxi]MED4053866.1 hypothetical protein [Niallia taxi]MED4120506.1 hypothetical protein [Niallia taxi]RVT61382.1 hypothetical protein EM808_14060 [Niallia taxi]